MSDGPMSDDPMSAGPMSNGPMSAGPSLPRRDLFGAGAALLVSFSLGRAARADEPGGSPPASSPAPLPGSLKETPELDAWIRVAADGGIQVFTGKAELGQGLKTALLQVAAEQLDVTPGSLGLVTADTGRTPDEGFTAGSHSMQDSGTAILHAAAQRSEEHTSELQSP